MLKITSLSIFLLIILSGCEAHFGSNEEIAIITCNIIKESRKMDTVFRIKEVNAARQKIGARPFLGSDEEIIEALKFGLCSDLVLDDDYETKLKVKQQKMEDDFWAQYRSEQKAKEERIQAEKKAKEERIQAEKKAKEERREAEKSLQARIDEGSETEAESLCLERGMSVSFCAQNSETYF